MLLNPLLPIRDKHETSPCNFPNIIRQTGDENTQTHRLDFCNHHLTPSSHN